MTVTLKWNFGGKIIQSYDRDVTGLLSDFLVAPHLEFYRKSFSLLELYRHISIILQESVLTLSLVMYVYMYMCGVCVCSW